MTVVVVVVMIRTLETSVHFLSGIPLNNTLYIIQKEIIQTIDKYDSRKFSVTVLSFPLVPVFHVS